MTFSHPSGLPPLIAFLSPYQLGEITGIILMVIVPVFFVLSLVRYILTKKGAWLAVLIVSTLMGFGLAGLAGYGIYKGVTHAAAARPTAASPGSASMAMATPDGAIRAQVPGDWEVQNLKARVDSYQIGCLRKNQIMMVVSEKKENFAGTLAEYAQKTSAAMAKRSEDGACTEPETVTIGGHPAVQYEMTATVHNVKLAYLVAVVESRSAYHQLLFWTSPSNKSVAFPVYHDVLDSVQVDE